MGLGVLELKLMGKYPFPLQSKQTFDLWTIPRCYREAPPMMSATLWAKFKFIPCLMDKK